MDTGKLLETLTLEEKAALCAGVGYWHTRAVERLGIEAIMVADGPHGLRKQEDGGDNLGLGQSAPATCYPTAATTANSFDRALLREVGTAIAEEALAEGVSVVLGPGVNIKRSPLCGRNFEYISEDPYLTGELAAAIIDGVQGRGVGTSLKHFAANNQEKWRLVSDSIIDERTLREIYLAGFEAAVTKAAPWTVMCAYNKLNGTYACQNEWLLNKVLREEWGFEGLVMTDWGAMDDRVAALAAGLDLEMPGSGRYNTERIVEAVKTGQLAIEVLDTAVGRVLAMVEKGTENRREGYRYDAEAHHALARRAAAEGAVLLKNEGGLLPVKEGQGIAVIGALAKTPRYQGAGSSKINSLRVDNTFDELAKLGIEADYAPGYSLKAGAGPDEALVAEACRVAEGKDVVLVFIGLTDEYESEGYDRDTLALPPAHDRLVEALDEVTDRIVVVLQQGAPVALPWRGKVKGILACYLGGQAGGGGCADVLTGRACPGGKLAESWPERLEDTPSCLYGPADGRQAQYREGLFVGYRWYDTAGRAVAFPFGFGLSYTAFEYADMRVEGPDAAGEICVFCTVRNTGAVAGAEVVQLYVAKESSCLVRAEKELKGFEKLWLAPGEQKEVCLRLDRRSFSYYNTAVKGWCVEGGRYKLLIGASSRDIRLQAAVELAGDGKENGMPGLEGTVYRALPSDGPFAVPDKDFRTLYGRALPAEHTGKPFTWNSTLDDLKDTGLGKIAMPIVDRVVAQHFGGADKDRSEQLMARAMTLEIPLRTLGLMSGGRLTLEQVEGIVDIANGHPLRGGKKLAGGKKKNGK